MKTLLFALLLSTGAEAAQLVFTDYDQDKLAHFLMRLPKTAVDSGEESLAGGRRVKTVFPRNSEALRIECISDFYGSSRIPSDSTCSGTLDENHASVEKGYDELRLLESRETIASALHPIMPHGTAEKRNFRAGEFDEGTDFSGRRTLIFDFFFECSVKSCQYRFAERILK